MTQVVSFDDYRPSPRYDSLPWTEARIEEGTASVGPWALIETITLTPTDADPANPATRSFTTQLASDGELWYRIVFADAQALEVGRQIQQAGVLVAVVGDRIGGDDELRQAIPQVDHAVVVVDTDRGLQRSSG